MNHGSDTASRVSEPDSLLVAASGLRITPSPWMDRDSGSRG
jgi:hypothetical protein